MKSGLDWSRGWVKVPRILFDTDGPFSPAVTGQKATRREAICDLLAIAAWDDKSDRKAGEIICGERWLASRWNWSRSTTKRFLKLLEGEGVIEWKRGTRKGEPSRIRVNSGPEMSPPVRTSFADQLPGNKNANNAGSVNQLRGPRSWTANGSPTKAEDALHYREGWKVTRERRDEAVSNEDRRYLEEERLGMRDY